MFTLQEKRLSKLIALMCNSGSGSVRYFGIQAACMKRFVGHEYRGFPIETMATDGAALLVNPDFLDTLSDSDAIFILAHEAFHKAARHPERLRDCAPDQQELVHMAADYAINLQLVKDADFPYPMPSESGLLDHKYVDRDGKPLNAERILFEMLKNATQIQVSMPQSGGDQQSPQQSSGQQSGGKDESQTDGKPQQSGGQDDSQGQDKGQQSGGSQQQSKPAPGNNQQTAPCGQLLPAPDDYSSQQAMIDNARAEALTAGNAPGYIQDITTESIVVRQDWRDRLKSLLAREFDKSDYSMRKPNNRYLHTGLILPSLKAPAVNRIAIVSDVSGSMDADQRAIAIEQATGLVADWQPKETVILHHNTQVMHRETLSCGQLPERKLQGSGGTSFGPVFEELNQNPPDAVLWFTDCAPGDRVSEPDYPVFWLCTDARSGKTWFDRCIGFGEFIPVW